MSKKKNDEDNEGFGREDLNAEILERVNNMKDCIDKIKLKLYNQETIENCTGPNFVKFMIEMEYLTMKV